MDGLICAHLQIHAQSHSHVQYSFKIHQQKGKFMNLCTCVNACPFWSHTLTAVHSQVTWMEVVVLTIVFSDSCSTLLSDDNRGCCKEKNQCGEVFTMDSLVTWQLDTTYHRCTLKTCSLFTLVFLPLPPPPSWWWWSTDYDHSPDFAVTGPSAHNVIVEGDNTADGASVAWKTITHVAPFTPVEEVEDAIPWATHQLLLSLEATGMGIVYNN